MLGGVLGADQLAAGLPGLGADRRVRHDLGLPQAARARRRAARPRIDWWGNITFAVGLIAVLVGITYGIQPYGGHTHGLDQPDWCSPAIVGGLAVLGAFCVIETRVAEPMFRLALFRIRAVHRRQPGQPAVRLGRGGLMFILIIWLQGIWLPLHGYSFERTPLWAGIAMLPLTVGFLIAGPLSGWLSDRFGARPFATGGMLVAALCFVLLELLPVNFAYWQFAPILLLQRDRHGPVRLAQPGRDHEQPAAGAPRRRRGHEHHVPELGHGAVHRHLLHADDRRASPRTLPATLQPRPGRAGRAARRRGPARPRCRRSPSLFAALLGYNPIQHAARPVR